MIDLTQKPNVHDLKKQALAIKLQMKSIDIIDVNLFRIIDFLGFFNNGKPNFIQKLFSEYFNVEPLKGFISAEKLNIADLLDHTFGKKLNEFIIGKLKTDAKNLNDIISISQRTNFNEFLKEIIFTIQDFTDQLIEVTDDLEKKELNFVLNQIKNTVGWCLHPANYKKLFKRPMNDLVFLTNVLHPLQIYNTYNLEVKKFQADTYITRCCSILLTVHPLKDIINTHLFSIIPGTEPFFIFEDRKTMYVWKFSKQRLRYWIKDPFLFKFSYFLAKNIIIFLKTQKGKYVNRNIKDAKVNLYKYVYFNALKLKNPKVNAMDYFKILL
ncbi:hypothetical protein LCDV1gp006 [Lymphocystis disease virus 1]|uniref:hypothetical protein n=1 Tax=Fish lymphocystis disease virus TaxID=36363 RepID=UPI0000161EBF|nr:hypothetical protein LCDV1gp006 [Lymphocystis disease virus 1]